MKVTLFLFTLFLCTTAIAKKNYISGSQKVTFRSGPSVNNKVLKMIESEEAVDVLEAGEEWTKVKDSDGQEGYILSRFLTAETPYSLRFKWQKSQMDKLKESTVELSEKNKALSSEVENLKQVEEELKNLRAGSADYLALKDNFDKLQKSSSSSEEKISALESKITTVYIYWFLAGAGVFLFGLIMGKLGRKKRGQSSIIL